MAEKDFKALCEALELDEVEESQEMHGIPFCASVTTREGQGGYDDSNVIKKYMNIDKFNDDECESLV